MMKKLYFVKTNGYNMIVSIDEENNARYLTETNDFPVNPTEAQAMEFLESVEDDSSWEDDCTKEEIFSDEVEILAEMEKEL